jgi:hypothetical protein
MDRHLGQLGRLAETRKDLAAALDWTVRCNALFSEFPHPATGPVPRHLVRLTAALGLPALEAGWQGRAVNPRARGRASINWEAGLNKAAALDAQIALASATVSLDALAEAVAAEVAGV